MSISLSEMMETIRMVQTEHLDIRTITMGINLRDCCGGSVGKTKRLVYEKTTRLAGGLTDVVERVEQEFGIPIINKRIAVSPVSEILGDADEEGAVELAATLDRVACELGVDFVGGYTALVHKGIGEADRTLIESLPRALSSTSRACASVSVASTRTGINMDAVRLLGDVIKEIAWRTAGQGGRGCARLVVFCNPVEDNPFMAGAFHGAGEGEAAINVGVSGPGVVLRALQRYPEADLGQVAEVIKKTAFKITRAGELVGRVVAQRLGVPFGIMDLSLAPTNTVNDSVAEILEEMGLERCGTHGTTAALALMNDAVKKGGAMASSYVGGLSGAFIPVSEDAGMVRSAMDGCLTLSKLEAMTAVCSVGLDMVVVPGDTPASTIAAIIADEAAIGVMNNKTTAVRIIPAPGRSERDMVEFGGLLGSAPVMPTNSFSSARFIARGGRVPAPLQALTN